MFTVALFTITKSSKPPKCPTNDHTNKTWHIAMQWNITWLCKGMQYWCVHATTWKNFENITLKWKNWVAKDYIWHDSFTWNVQKREIYKDKEQISGCTGRRTEKRGKYLMGRDLSFWDDKNVLKLTVVMVLYAYKYTQNHLIVHFEWVKCMVCKSYVNKTILKIL